MNVAYGYAPCIPDGWSLYDRDIMPGDSCILYKDPETHLLSETDDMVFGEDDTHVELLMPHRQVRPIWDISCRSTPNYGYNEELDFGDVVYETLNIRDPNVVYHPFLEEHAFESVRPQRGLGWHMGRYKNVITGARLDTILYNGYFALPKGVKPKCYTCIMARDRLVKELICEEKASGFVNTGDIEHDHIRRGVTGEPTAKRAIERRHPDHPTLYEFGTLPLRDYKWVNLSIDSCDETGKNGEFKMPAVLDRLFGEIQCKKEVNDAIPELERLIAEQNIYIKPELRSVRMQVNYLIADQLRRPDNVYTLRSLWDRVNNFEFADEELFLALGKELYPPNAYHCHNEESSRDLGFYFHQINMQDHLSGIRCSSKYNYNYLLGVIEEIKVRRREDYLKHVLVELNMFLDYVMALRCEKKVTFEKYMEMNLLH
jgi:hypothetical protein